MIKNNRSKPIKKIFLLYGGCSTEHDISCVSANYLFSLLLKLGYIVYPIYMTRDQKFFLQDEIINNIDKKDLNHPATFIYEDQLYCSFHNQKEVVEFIFPIIHGRYGEDGCLQGFAEFYGVPYAGCTPLTSAICMHKKYMHDVFSNIHLLQVPYTFLHSSQFSDTKDSHIALTIIKETLELPIFVKPCNAGSSLGVSKVLNWEDLSQALHTAFEYDHSVVIEKGINVRELEVAIIGSYGDYKVSEVGEICTYNDFYSYDAKYISKDKAKLFIPALLSNEIKIKVQDLAKRAFQAVAGDGFARVDFFLEEGNNQIYINEINTLPGFTPISMFLKLWEQANIDILDVIDNIINLGYRRYQRSNNLKLVSSVPS